MKALVEACGNRILSFAMFGCLAACRKMVALKLIGPEDLPLIEKAVTRDFSKDGSENVLYA